MLTARSRRRDAALALLCSVVWSSAAAGQRLQRAGEAIRQKDDTPAERPSTSRPRHSPTTDTAGSDDDAAASQVNCELCAQIALFPWFLPNLMVEAERPAGSAAAQRFASFPYANGSRGPLLGRTATAPRASYEPARSERPSTPAETSLAQEGQAMAAQVAVETGHSLHAGLTRGAASARWQLPFRLEFDSDWSVYREHYANQTDYAVFGREHLTLRFAEASNLQFHSGVGPVHWRDALGWAHGADFTWGFESFPGRPFSLAAEASFGFLGRAAIAALRGEVGVFVERLQIGAGWQQHFIGPVALGGPFVTTRLWF